MNIVQAHRPIVELPTQPLAHPAWLRRLVMRWRAERDRARQMRALAALDARLLADIGVDAEQARAELSRSLAARLFG